MEIESVKSSLREYGVIIVLIIVSVSGYLLFSQNKEDILAYSLDVLGTKLVALIDDEAAKQRVSEAFGRFQEQVLNQEVSAEQVEMIAANVLNLSNAGTRLSPEEAEFVLNMKPESFAATLPAPDLTAPGGVTDPKVPPAPPEAPLFTGRTVQLTRLGENLEAMFEFSDAVQGEAKTATRFIRFGSDEKGIHVVVDPEFEKQFQSGRVIPATRELDRKNLVRWKKELEKDVEKSALIFEKDALILADIQLSVGQSQERSDRIRTLRRIRHLQSLGVIAGVDSAAISLEIAQIVSGVNAELDVVMKDLRGITVVRSDSLSQRRQ